MRSMFLVTGILASLVACGAPPPPYAGPSSYGGPQPSGYGPGRPAPSVISENEAETLTQQVIDFKAQRNTLRGLLANEPNPSVRADRMRDLDRVNRVLQELEYRLRAAGRPVP